jgi:predicted TIM-barrel fold metal-dependent hydrolase
MPRETLASRVANQLSRLIKDEVKHKWLGGNAARLLRV